MRSTWVSLLLGIAVPPVALWCQQVREFGPQITLTTSDPLATRSNETASREP